MTTPYLLPKPGPLTMPAQPPFTTTTPHLTRYAKDELLAILNERCPDELAKFPSPDDFKIGIHKRDNIVNINPAVWVGNRIGPPNEALWLEEYRDEANTEWTAVPNPKLAHWIGLHYTNTQGAPQNKYMLEGFRGNNVFGRLGRPETMDRVASPFSLRMKAILRFVMMHCGYVNGWEEFVDKNGKKHGIQILVGAIKTLVKRMEREGDVDGTERVMAGAETQDEGDAENEDEDGLDAVIRAVLNTDHGDQADAGDEDEDGSIVSEKEGRKRAPLGDGDEGAKKKVCTVDGLE